MQKHKVVLKDHKDELIENFKGLAPRCLIEILVANIDYVEQSHVNHQLHLDSRAIEQSERYQNEKRSARQKDK